MNDINSFPMTVDVAITGACNLRCKHCNTSDTWSLKNELTFEELRNVFDQLKDLKVFNVNLFGGEPLFYEKRTELFKMLNEYPFRLTVLTNGTLIDERCADELARLRFLGSIQVSVDGSTPEIHDWQRGKGSFEKAVEGIKLLERRDLPVTMKAVINTQNYEDIENMLKLALSLGLDGMDFGDAVECGRAAVYASDMRFKGETNKYIMEEMFRIRNIYPGVRIGGTLGQKMDMLEEFYEKGPGNGSRGTFSTCPAGQNMLSIRSDGKVVPCSAFWTLICGDVREDTLEHIWYNSETLNNIRKLADVPLTAYGKNCSSCDYLSYCNGGCRASAYYSCGRDLKGIDPNNCLVFSGILGYRVSAEKVLEQ